MPGTRTLYGVIHSILKITLLLPLSQPAQGYSKSVEELRLKPPQRGSNQRCCHLFTQQTRKPLSPRAPLCSPGTPSAWHTVGDY